MDALRASSWSTGQLDQASGRRTSQGRRERSGRQTEFVIEEPTVPQLQTREDQDGNEVLPWLRVFYVPNIPFHEGYPSSMPTPRSPARGEVDRRCAGSSGRQVGSIRQSGAIDDQGRIGFCGRSKW